MQEGAEHSVRLEGIGVRFEIPVERIGSFKEYLLRRLTARIERRTLWALRSVDLELAPGETLGIVGRNGAGKSTLLKVISRVVRPTEGRVVVRGRTAPLLELGAGFHPDLTGRENVYLNATIFGFPRELIDRHLDEIVEFAELPRFIDLPIRSYSSGMVARLGFSVATQFRPDILILDEILSVGDAGFQQKCLERVSRFRARGTSILLASHDLVTLEAYCDRLLWLDEGRIADLGAPGEVLESYKDTFVQAGSRVTSL